MAEPKIVAECVKAMKQAVDIPVTVKTRLGIDEQDDDFLYAFTDAVLEAGAVNSPYMLEKLASGLSPKENRDIPELQYDRVYKHERYNSLPVAVWRYRCRSVTEHLQHMHGVMVGRAAYQNPWLLTTCDAYW